jgi:hypothetical protein
MFLIFYFFFFRWRRARRIVKLRNRTDDRSNQIIRSADNNKTPGSSLTHRYTSGVYIYITGGCCCLVSLIDTEKIVDESSKKTKMNKSNN